MSSKKANSKSIAILATSSLRRATTSADIASKRKRQYAETDWITANKGTTMIRTTGARAEASGKSSSLTFKKKEQRL